VAEQHQWPYFGGKTLPQFKFWQKLAWEMISSAALESSVAVEQNRMTFSNDDTSNLVSFDGTRQQQKSKKSSHSTSNSTSRTTPNAKSKHSPVVYTPRATFYVLHAL
jgi:hypothetical protein